MTSWMIDVFANFVFGFSVGYFIEPTLVETKDPNSKLLNEVTTDSLVLRFQVVVLWFCIRKF